MVSSAGREAREGVVMMTRDGFEFAYTAELSRPLNITMAENVQIACDIYESERTKADAELSGAKATIAELRGALEEARNAAASIVLGDPVFHVSSQEWAAILARARLKP